MSGASTVASAAALGAAVGEDILARRPNPQTATFASEILTIGAPDRSERVFCKYGPVPADDDAEGRRGLGYEARVYSEVLAPLDLGTPRLRGFYRDPSTGIEVLAVSYEEGLESGDRRDDREGALREAARWIGGFHAAAERLVAGGAPRGIARYGPDEYVAWARRTASLARDLADTHPWLLAACRGFEDVVESLAAAAPTVAHGDYYLDNVLMGHGRVVPVDWEWAAVAAGEIDLAALTFHWPEDVVAACETEYRAARWPAGAPEEADLVLTVARLWVCLRYMGVSRSWLLDERRAWRFDEVRRLSERLGLVEP